MTSDGMVDKEVLLSQLKIAIEENDTDLISEIIS